MNEDLLSICPTCDGPAKRDYTEQGVPQMNLKGASPTADGTKDEKEYRGWQQAIWAKYTDKIHPDNIGEYKGLKHLAG